MTTEDDFQRMLDENPGDHTTRLVFADWLDERGDPRAAGYRALGDQRRVVANRALWWSFVTRNNSWAWSGAFKDGELLDFALSDVWIEHIAICEELRNRSNWEAGWRSYLTRQDDPNAAGG